MTTKKKTKTEKGHFKTLALSGQCNKLYFVVGKGYSENESNRYECIQR